MSKNDTEFSQLLVMCPLLTVGFYDVVEEGRRKYSDVIGVSIKLFSHFGKERWDVLYNWALIGAFRDVNDHDEVLIALDRLLKRTSIKQLNSLPHDTLKTILRCP